MLSIEQFIQTYVLKAGETIDPYIEAITPQLLQYTILKQSARTSRKVAHLKIAAATQGTPPETLQAYKWTPKAKRQLQEPHATLFEWLSAGWIVHEMRFEKDSISLKESFYRMGPSFMQYELQMQAQQHQLHKQLQMQADALAIPKTLRPLFDGPEHFPTSWPRAKREKFLHFVLAFFTIAKTKSLFDYKEIGATYYDRIGGSKYFDRERDDFLAFLETLSVDPAAHGLISHGKIVPIFFSGPLTGQLAQFTYGSVHALTDDSLLRDHFQTTARHLWLVENRAILTRMAAEPSFLQESASFILCLDGQIRSAHRALIQMLVSHVAHVFIWTDYDEAGYTIAKHAQKLSAKLPTTFIGHSGQLFHTFAEYEAAFDGTQHEQEQQLGGVAQWKTWIQSSPFSTKDSTPLK